MPVFDANSLAHHAKLMSQYVDSHKPQTSDGADPVQATKPEPKWPYAVAIGGQAADVGTTLGAIYGTGGKMEEKNPAGMAGVMAVKAAAIPAIAYLMHKIHKSGDDKSMKALGIIAGVAGLIPASINAKRMMALR